jgi:hypothetical protein
MIERVNKRKDECLFCSSRNCHTRIYRREVPIYDELACGKHIEELQNHADKVLGRRNGVYRNHVSGTGNYKRGEVYQWELEKV